MNKVYRPYQERKADRLEELKEQRRKATAAGLPRAWKVVDLMKQKFPPAKPSSKDRLLEVSSGNWSPQAFRDAANQLDDENISCSIYESGQRPPRLEESLTNSKYGPEYEAAVARTSNRTKIAVVTEASQVIGFGIASHGPSESVFEFLQVEKFSLRRCGLRLEIAIEGGTFSVGIGHLIVARLADVVMKPIRVNAENPESEYIFRSLGFVDRADTDELYFLG